MKRLTYILLIIIALGCSMPSAMAEVNGVTQRAELVATATGGTGRIAFVAGPTDAVFQIYAITGQLLKTVRLSANGQASIDMPKGFYVVKCNGQWSRKVIVK
ncbi:MAG: T9SS type A sorting domain-containing protein [Muribaculaceae bacterium]|nr:T9SS type A sorting domain-containing protein [Muribaculaceae bacterium]